MCRNGWKYSVVLQMAEVFVIHMALKVHPQGLRESVCLHVHAQMSMRAGFCESKCVCLALHPQC